MLEGVIIKGIGGFYYVMTRKGVFECRARGIFRERNLVPLIGDRVLIRMREEGGAGYIEEILDRKSHLTRPPVANATQVIIVVSIKKPDINYWLLDRFIIMAEHENLKIKICLNKIDLVDENDMNYITDTYTKANYGVIRTSTITGEGIVGLKRILKDNITVFAGPSGVGKSSLINSINPKLNLETGEVSKKTTRGKHTTRHVELINLDVNSYVVDTPGFSSLDIGFIERDTELAEYFTEIYSYGHRCKFVGCLHHKEPDCEVKLQVENGNISNTRYENYINFLKEIQNIRRY